MGRGSAPLAAGPVAGRPDVKWATRYLAQDLLADITNSGHKVEKTIIIEAVAFYEQGSSAKQFAPVGETTAVQRIHDRVGIAAAGTAVAAGIVAFVDLSLDSATARQVLQAHLQACPNLVGCRFANSFDAAAGAKPHSVMHGLDDLAEESLLADEVRETRQKNLSFLHHICKKIRSIAKGEHEENWKLSRDFVNARQAVLEACILCAPQVRENIQLIAELGLTLDLWSHHNHLPQVIETQRR